ncbi:uncharacterized protein LOC135615655 [Musa acuminata AAA Group]|uniref:uncharacterized protein LOC135606810 n=1 Tax=Musa acuminata AAA Group TaxID=214697 RepID=UPI0031D420E1
MEEALKAKEIAERKFNSKDVKGAKKFALKAQNLYPSLEGISQMIATLDVHLAAEKKINGESDWYAILSVNALADEEALKKHYRKLALQLHPDKNKSVGAEGAFKLISEAWSVLSDKNRKTAYDQNRNVNGFQNKASQPHMDHSAHNSANGFHSFSNTTTSNKRARKSNNSSGKSVVPPQTHTVNLNTFWTSCKQCRMQYEYLRIYLNHNLLCPNCHQAFLAVEIGIPGNAANSSVPWSAKQHQHNSNHSYQLKNGYSSGFSTSTYPGTGPMEFQNGGNFDSYNHQNFQWSSLTGSAGTASNADSPFQAAHLVHKKLEKKRRKYEKLQAAAQREESLQTDSHVYKNTVDGSGTYNSGHISSAYDWEQPVSKVGRPAKRRCNGDQSSIYHGRDEAENMSTSIEKTANPEVQRANGAFEDIPRTRMTARQNNFILEFSQINIRQMLIEKVKATVVNKLEEWNLAQSTKLVEKEKLKQKGGQEAAVMDGGDTGKQTCLDDASMKEPILDHDDNKAKEVPKPVSIDVPDPDFYDFDKDRLERTFEGDQVWATYDSEDGMPRLYAMVQKVLSLNPFKIRMSFLNSKSNSELGPINWIASGFAKTCGDFRVSRYQISDTVNIFSHKVRWEKGPRGVIRIVPKKGDIWALYRNWSPDWNELTPDDVIYKYEMVEILDDYSDEDGVSVIPLVKVAGFKAIFHRHMDPLEAKRIARGEMFRFSHQVPSYLLTGEESHSALKGCLELDPAATPIELLQVITEVKEDVGMETNEQQSVKQY